MMLVFAWLLYCGGLAGARKRGASRLDAICWPEQLGRALANFAYDNGDHQ